MPFRRTERTTFYEVSGEEPLDNAHNPDSGKFLPDFVRVREYNANEVKFEVAGPVLDKAGKPLKSKRGLTSYDLVDVEAGRMFWDDAPADVAEVVPAWLIELAGAHQGAQAVPPKWSTEPGTMAIAVGRGEPARTGLEMEKAVSEQATEYLTHFVTGTYSPVEIALTVQLIAKDHITPRVNQGVTLSREHFLLYAEAAKKQLGEVKADGPQ